MNINLISLIYLAFRLAPFIFITYFILNYMIYSEIKSVIFLGGLILACFFAIMTGNYFSIFSTLPDERKNSMCNILTLTDKGPLSNLPLSLVIYVYTLSYLGIPILKYERNISNIPLLVFLPIIAFFDILWLYIFGCCSMINIFGAGVVGMTVGLLWSFIIYKSSLRKIQYHSILTDTPECTMNADSTFTCIQRSTVGADSTIPTAKKATSSAPSPEFSLGPSASKRSLLGSKFKSLFQSAQNIG